MRFSNTLLAKDLRTTNRLLSKPRMSRSPTSFAASTRATPERTFPSKIKRPDSVRYSVPDGNSGNGTGYEPGVGPSQRLWMARMAAIALKGA